MSYSVSIAHLSDLHFGENSRFGDHDLDILGRKSAASIKIGMKQIFNKEKPDIVVVTGDITQRAYKWEFGQAIRYFTSLQTYLGVDRSNFLFLPGNHDVSWVECENFFKSRHIENLSKYDKEIDIEKFEQFNRFKNEFYEKDMPGIVKDYGVFIYLYEQFRLCIVALNSCELITHKYHVGHISEYQAKIVIDLLNEDYKDYIKIIVLHHAVNASSDRVKEYVDTLKECINTKNIEKELLEKYINDGPNVEGNDRIRSMMKHCHVHLLLHGHQHSNDEPGEIKWYSEEPVRGQICPAGSFGLSTDKLPIDQTNSMRLIHLGKMGDQLVLKTSQLKYDPQKYIPGEPDKGCFDVVNSDLHKVYFPIDFDLPPCHEFINERVESNKGENIFSEIVEVSVDDAGSIDRKTYLENDRFVEFAHIPMLIRVILQDSPELCTKLAAILDIENDVEGLLQDILDIGFENLWYIISGSVSQFNKCSEELKRVLFLLAQMTIKPDALKEVRQNIELKHQGVVVELPIRYALVAELMLKTAVETEIKVCRTIQNGRPHVLVEDMITIPDHGIDSEKLNDYLIEELAKRFAELSSVPKAELRNRLIKRLKVRYQSGEPFLFVTSNKSIRQIPYLALVLIPESNKPVPYTGVTYIDEDTIYELINIILMTLSDK